MFSIPITLVIGNPNGLPRLLSAGVDLDTILKVEPISLDSDEPNRLLSYQNSDYLPHTIIHLLDGRSIPVREQPDEINAYLDAYHSLEKFFTDTPLADRPPATMIRGGLRLIHGGQCDTSAVSTPA